MDFLFKLFYILSNRIKIGENVMQYPLEPDWTNLGNADTYLNKYDGEALKQMGITTSAADNYDSKYYKQMTAETLGASQWISNVSPGVRAQIYDHIARTVNAIEQGRKRSWRLNTASQDVSNASIQLMEICRQKLYDIQEKSPQLNEDQKAEARQAVFATLDKIRRANSGQKTWTWGKEFCKALGKDIKTLSFSRELLKITGVVLVGLVVAGLVGAGLLGPVAPLALPVFFLAAVSWVAFRIGRSIYNACKNANKVVNEKKAELGKEVIENAAILSERALKTAITDQEKKNQQAMVKPMADLKAAQSELALLNQELENHTRTLYQPMKQMDAQLAVFADALDSSPKTAEGKKLLEDTIKTLSSSVKKTDQAREAQTIIRDKYQKPLEDRFRQFIIQHPKAQVEAKYQDLSKKVKTVEGLVSIAQKAVENAQISGAQALEKVKTGSREARAAGLATIRENRSKDNMGTMKDELEAGRKERAAAAAAKTATSGGPAATTKKL